MRQVPQTPVLPDSLRLVHVPPDSVRRVPQTPVLPDSLRLVLPDSLILVRQRPVDADAVVRSLWGC